MTSSDSQSADIAAALDAAHTQSGESLAALTERAPALLVFLRHLG